MSENLKSYAVTESQSRGRIFPQQRHRYRSDLERDRDRIIHSVAFRRLEGKTQVFTPGLDDSYRNRLTHSIEVAQVGRTIAKALNINQNLTEAICLGHDLGHSPFGHAGETVLNKLMADFGGFEHNGQTLRIVDFLEHPYPDFLGLNLMYETRLGLAKHESTYDKPTDVTFAEKNCTLEGQIAKVADRIAYNCNDLEDGLRAGIIKAEQLEQIEIYNIAEEAINARAIKDTFIKRTRTAKAIIEILVSDCIETSAGAIDSAQIESVDQVTSNARDLVSISPENDKRLSQLEGFLLRDFYMNPEIKKNVEKIELSLENLFTRLCGNRNLMPRYFVQLAEKYGTERIVCDYIAGMTDRYCLKLLEKTGL